MATRVKAPRFTTPAGIFVWPRLGEADTKFKPEGEYSVKVRFKQTAVQTLLDKLEPIHATAIAEGKKAYAALPVASRKKLDTKGGFTVNPLFTPVFDDQEVETGEVELSFKMTATGVIKSGPKVGQKWSQKPAVFDAKMKPMNGTKVWGGSKGIISFEIGLSKEGTPGYFIPGSGSAGLKLALKAVQVIDLLQGGARSASDYGFGEQEGYEGSDEPEETTDTANSTTKTETAGAADEPQDF